MRQDLGVAHRVVEEKVFGSKGADGRARRAIANPVAPGNIRDRVADDAVELNWRRVVVVEDFDISTVTVVADVSYRRIVRGADGRTSVRSSKG